MWKLKKIPKIVHFYWGEEQLPFLRYLAISSFNKYNPDWEIKFYYPKFRNKEISWTTHEQKYDIKIKKDYYEELKKLPVEFIEVDFKFLNVKTKLSEVHKASFLRQYLLSTTGGLWSDMDIIYFKPISNLTINKKENNNIDTIVCSGFYGHSVAFMLTSPNNEFLNFTYNKAKEIFNPKNYQSVGSLLVNRYFPKLEDISNQFPNLNIANISMEIVYAYNARIIPEIYNSSDLSKYTKNSIGLHWYGGYKLAGEYISKLDETTYESFNNVLSKTIGKSLKGVSNGEY